MANKITTVLDLDGSKFGRGIKQTIDQVKQADGAINKLKAGWSGLVAAFAASPAAMAGAAAGLGLAVKKMATDASNLEESVNAVNVTFGSASDSVLAFGANSDKALGLSERAFNQLSVQLSSFAENIAGGAGGAPDVIEDLTTRIADFASVQNLDVEEAGRVFISTLAGETEAIRRYGKDLSAARVEQFALTSGLIDTKSELTENIKVQARYALLMQETADTAGDFANTSDSLANQQRILSAQVENLSASFGSQLTPILADAAGTVNNLISSFEDLQRLASQGGGDGGNTKPWVDALVGAVKPLEALKGALDLTEKATAKLDEATGESTVRIEGTTNAIDALRPVQERYIAGLEDAARANRHVNQELAALRSQQNDYVSGLEDAAYAADKQAEAERNAADALERKRDALVDSIDSFGDYERAQLDVEDAQARLEEAQADYNDLLDDGAASAEDVARSLEDVARANERVDSATANVADAVADYNRLIEDSVATDREKADALRAVEDAERGVQDAIRGREDAFRGVDDAERNLERAREDLMLLQQELASPEGQERTKTVQGSVNARRQLEDAQRRVEDAERDLADAQRDTEDSSRDLDDAYQDLIDSQEQQRRLLEEGTVTDEEKQRALDEIAAAQGRLEQAQRDANQAILDHEGVLRGSMVTDAEKEAALRNIERAELDLVSALGNQATAWATEKGAIEGSTTALALQRQELERLRDEVSPSVRAELDRLIEKYNSIPGVAASFSQLPVGAREGGTVEIRVTVDAVLNNPAETGRQVANALDAYFRAGGAPPPGLARIFLS